MLTFNSPRKFNFRSLALVTTIAAGLASNMVGTAYAAAEEAPEATAFVGRAMPAEPTYSDVHDMATCETAKLTVMNPFDTRVRIVTQYFTNVSDSEAALAVTALSDTASADLGKSQSSAAMDDTNWLAPGASRTFDIPENGFLGGRMLLGRTVFNVFYFQDTKFSTSTVRSKLGLRKSSAPGLRAMLGMQENWVLLAEQAE